MGCLFASALTRAGHPVTLLLRKGSGMSIATIRVDENGAVGHRLELPVSTPADSGHISHLLVTTKAPDVCPAVLSLRHRLDGASQVLLLANGLGFAEELRRELPLPAYFSGTTTEGAYRVGARHVHHAGAGLTRIGRQGVNEPPAWFSEWSEAVRPSLWDAQIDGALWLKLAINCAINPLTALHRCLNGELAEPRFAPAVGELVEEIMRVSAAAGFAAVTADLPAQVATVIRATANNRSSMLQDVLAGRHTEIDYITGYLLRVAGRHGIEAPRNEELMRSIVDLEP